ncbi:hypothetical protein AK812_SmicGene14930 [Symbiodinium microadriaticum]|uniref:Uncharacterized protein n=1 Tax=Symbiodinium microadriaticum TaxID=2951 RepID=A0A1Q9E4B5_SYMMI|nr:hypothetical protein AK812_SmicGene14930 [Symbiodinium microadriaticum]
MFSIPKWHGSRGWRISQIALHQLPCNGLVGCDSEEVVVGSGRRNIVKITLPTEMSSIDETTTHTIKEAMS